MTTLDLNQFHLSANDRALLDRLGVPQPTIAPTALWQQLMAQRNEWFLHRRQCDLSGAEILSAYPATVLFPVYKNEIWWGDGWDPLSFGREFDFSKPFFEQFHELRQVVPREGTSIFNSENCAYNSHIRESRNCYMNSLVYRCEDTHYSYWAVNDKDVVDCLLTNGSTLCYDCLDCTQLYECVALQECHTCHNCYFSYQLRGCEFCIGCTNLVNKRYYVENKPVSEGEFRATLASILNGTRKGYRDGQAMFERAYAQALHRPVHNVNCEEVTGDHVLNSRRCHFAFDGSEGEDVNYTISFGDSRNILGAYSAGWPRCEDVAFCAVSRGSQDIAYCYYTFFSSGLRYCDSMNSCHDCFACVGLRHARNCILNRQYSTDEYRRLRSRIIDHMKETGEWGHYFPISISTFPYNESAASDYYPLSRNEVIRNGWAWNEERDDQSLSGSGDHAPASLQELPLDLSAAIYRCEETDKPFRLIKAELDFYQRMHIPPPCTAPRSRHLARLKRRNDFALYQRACAKSGTRIISSFPEGRSETVVSEDEYLISLR